MNIWIRCLRMLDDKKLKAPDRIWENLEKDLNNNIQIIVSQKK